MPQVSAGRNLADKIVPNQFRLHEDTTNFRRNVTAIKPTDFISISDKWHGTSVVISNVLTVRDLPWYESLLKRLGVRVVEQTYGLVYSSRRVIKAVNAHQTKSNHYYSEDAWGIVAKEVKDRLPAGFTVYGEIVGFSPDGAAIQKGYHYGCPVGGHRFVVYRVTLTNAEGLPVELGWKQMQEFCAKYGFIMVPTYWYGVASEWGSDELKHLAAVNEQDWQIQLLHELETMFVNDQMCLYNNSEVPAEGIVLRIDGLHSAEAFKLKNFKFLEWETKQLDKGVLDLETQEAEVATV